MRVRSLPAFSRIFAVSFFALFGLRAIAATSDFAITAANVNMPASGNGSSEYTVTAIPMTGSLTVTCQYSGAATVARIPNCTYGPIEALPVTAGQTVTGTIDFLPYGSAVPLGLHRQAHAPGAGLALAGALLLGFGFRRRARGWFALVVLAVGTLAGVAGITACAGGSMVSMTPGTYQYTISAGNVPGGSNLLSGMSTSTTINVTIP
jgi:hypothetical protein